MYTPKPNLVVRFFIAMMATMLFSSTSGATNDEDRLAILELTLNEMQRGDVLVILRGKDILVHVDALHAAGLIDVHGRVEKVAGKRFISLASVTPALRFSFNEETQKLQVTAAGEMFGKTTIDLTHRRPVDIEYRTDASAFINYSWTLKNFYEPSGFAEGGLSIGGALLSSTVFGSMQTGVVRGLTNLIYDERKYLARITLGDTFVSGGELASGQFIGGFSISKNFGIDPYYIRQPSMGYTGTALTPSTLDVWVNGTRLQSTPIAPGPFQVQNLPVTVGTGDIRYVLRDVFGQEHAVDTRYSMVANQLKKGTSEYTYALGFRRFEMGTESFDYRQLMALGTHRLGVTDKLTMGARLEGRADLMSGGASAQFILPFGHASISAAASRGTSSAGFAVVGRIGYRTRRVVAMAMVQGTSPHYATAGLEPTADRNLIEARVSAAIAPWQRLSLSTDTMLAIPRDIPAYVRFGASLNLIIVKRFLFVASTHGVINSDRVPGAEVSGMLTYAFDNGVIASSGARTTQTTPEAFATVNKPLTQVIDSGFRASGTLGAQSRGEIAVESQGTQGRFMASLSGDGTGANAMFQASGAIVAVKGAGIFVTRPLQNGFAVIQVPGIRGVTGYLENQEMGQTDEDGNLLIPNLLSYYGSRISVNPADFPLDVQVPQTERIVSPPLRGGALIRFPAKHMHLYRGHARIDKQGQRIIPSYGEIEVSRAKEVHNSPLGKNGEFELPDLSAGHYQGKITYSNGVCAFDFEATAGTSIVVEIGTIVCTMKREGEGQ
jgi:outer membrane usher protein